MAKEKTPEDKLMGAIFGEKDESPVEPDIQQIVDSGDENDNSNSQLIEVRQTPEFLDWLRGLRDRTAQQRIATRLACAQSGNLGDVSFFDGIGEFRIDYGPGYRLYFVKKGKVLVVLLCGGDKKTQARDIKRAVEMAKEV